MTLDERIAELESLEREVALLATRLNNIGITSQFEEIVESIGCDLDAAYIARARRDRSGLLESRLESSKP